MSVSTAPAPTRSALSLPPDVRWHRPLLAIAAAMAVLTVVAVVGLLLDPREVTGAPVWAKPLKFAISTLVYTVTLAWLIGQFAAGSRLARLGRVAGTVIAIGLAVEIVVITGFAIAGESSHFNVTTAFHAVAWGVMAITITLIWAMTLVLAVLLFRAPLGDAARSLSIRAGAVLALAGMALAFLMTGPQGDQISNYTGIVGAHTVGAADGGPGLPILGWSTVAGDLRIPHFVGMHALQVLPLVALALEALARRVPLLADATLRLRLVGIATGAYAAAVGLVTWQALIGQPITAPAGAIPVVAAIVAAAALVAVVASVLSARRARV